MSSHRNRPCSHPTTKILPHKPNTGAHKPSEPVAVKIIFLVLASGSVPCQPTFNSTSLPAKEHIYEKEEEDYYRSCISPVCQHHQHVVAALTPRSCNKSHQLLSCSMYPFSLSQCSPSGILRLGNAGVLSVHWYLKENREKY